MKFRFVPMIAIALLFMVSCSREISSTSSTSTSSEASSETSSKASSTTKSKASTKVASFVAAEHSTEGYARIVSENGRRFIEFDKSFKTDNGPDLFVILYRNSSVPKTGVKEQDYVQLAPLEKTMVVNATLFLKM